ncbi:MAG: lipid IV(A) 3-deoxy-D-manno-octulosonic acid transferase [Pseudomonadales bacterium]|nr:lipid IV(A) 3-deoxy-D-manno-octulosonic acid transferase [Pseudomonadales bacterium]
MNRTVYSIMFYLALPLIVLRLLWRSVRAPAYAQRWGERFGLVRQARQSYQAAADARWLWVHAVSVGEVNAAAPIIRELLGKKNIELVVTVMTPTGSDRLRELFGDSVCHVYAPYDYPGAVKRFLRVFKPELLVLMETELWPNMIHFSHQAGLRMLLANARLSEKSFRGYEKFARLGKPMLAQLDLIAAQSASDAERFRRLGVAAERVQLTGSIKFDITLPADLDVRVSALAGRLQGQRPIIVAASTREGEEEKVLNAFRHCLQEVPELLLVLVPRHPERFNAVARLCESRSLPVVRRSSADPVGPLVKVLLGDSMGEMSVYLGLADIAFVGGSLVDTGCQNVLEPAALGLPVLVGPSQFNFQHICEQLEAAGALQTVADEKALAAAILALLNEETLRQRMGQAGMAVIRANRGALQRTLAMLEALLK